MNNNILLLGNTLESKIINFFTNNSNPSDKQVHKFAENNGINKHKLEEEIYKFLSTFLCGGKYQSSSKNLIYDMDELKMGDRVELEHVDKNSSYAKYIARRIALDHLAEFDGKYYYTALDKSEKDLETKMEGGNDNLYKKKYIKYKNKYFKAKCSQ